MPEKKTPSKSNKSNVRSLKSNVSKTIVGDQTSLNSPELHFCKIPNIEITQLFYSEDDEEFPVSPNIRGMSVPKSKVKPPGSLRSLSPKRAGP